MGKDVSTSARIVQPALPLQSSHLVHPVTLPVLEESLGPLLLQTSKDFQVRLSACALFASPHLQKIAPMIFRSFNLSIQVSTELTPSLHHALNASSEKYSSEEGGAGSDDDAPPIDSSFSPEVVSVGVRNSELISTVVVGHRHLHHDNLVLFCQMSQYLWLQLGSRDDS